MVYVKEKAGPANVGDSTLKFTVHYFDKGGNLTIRSGGTRAWRCNNPGDADNPCWLLRIEPSKEEIALCLSEDLRDFCDKHIGKQISVEGAIFPEHTTHHP